MNLSVKNLFAKPSPMTCFTFFFVHVLFNFTPHKFRVGFAMLSFQIRNYTKKTLINGGWPSFTVYTLNSKGLLIAIQNQVSFPLTQFVYGYVGFNVIFT